MQFLKSLRARLLLLVLFAVIPALGVTLYLGLQLRNQARESATESALRYTRSVASFESTQVEAARQLLKTLVVLPEIRGADSESCTRFLKGLQSNYSNYSTFTLLDLDGNIICSSTPPSTPVNFADRDYFQDVLTKKEFVFGEATIGRLTGNPIIPLAAPVLNDSGNTAAVMVISVRLETLLNLEEIKNLPANSAILVVNSQGTVLLRFPTGENWVGKTIPEAPIIREILSTRKEDTAETAGIDGIRRLYAFTPLESDPNSIMYASVGIPSRVVFSEADTILWSSLLLMGFASALALLAAWFGGDLFFLRVVSLTAERDAAEQKLRDINRVLEERVKERTAALAKANIQLTVELQERRKAEALAESRAREAEEGRNTLEALMAFIPEGIAIAEGPEMVIQRVSQFGREVVGAKANDGGESHIPYDLLNLRLYRPDSDEPAAQEEYPLYRAIHQGEVITDEEWALVSDDGKRAFLLCNAGPIRSASGEITGGVIAWHDITERKQVNASLREYAVQLERSNRELQDFAYIASHDLQEPLRKIQAFGERLMRRAGEQLSDENRDYIERMNTSANRMQTMISDLLTYSRVTTRGGMLIPIDLAQVIWDVVSDLEVRIQETGGEVQVDDLPVVEADPLQMRQLFQNLISNALKFHQTDTKPVVRISGEVRRTGWRPDDRELLICVEDNGIGFDDKYLDRIFMPFQRLHGRNEYEGSGIGLAICRKIVERHHGSITAHSEPGVGTRFFITLPVRQPTKEGESQ